MISLETLIGYYESSVEQSYDARQKAERDRDFYDNKQWTHDEQQELIRRGQTPVVINKVASKVDWMLGMERQLRADPKAFPRTPVHEDAAHAVTDALRYVVDNNSFDATASIAAEQLFIEGIEVATVEVEPKGQDFEIIIKPVKWDRFFYDPHSRKHDFSDAKYMGVVIWMDLEDAKRQFPNKSGWLQRNMNTADPGDTYDDKPQGIWYDRKRNRVMVVQMYFRHASKWHHCIFTRGLFLRGPEPSAYLDSDGLPENCIVAQSAKMDRGGNRYGAVRQYIDPQKELNKRRSKFLHLLSQRQTLGEKGAVEDVAATKRELAKSDGHVEVNPNMRFEVLPNEDMSTGQFQLYQAASQEIDGMGANPALQGRQEGDTSGRALEMRSQAGLMEMGPFFDNHRMWKRRIYRAIWNRVKQFWTEERWIRVTDNDENLKWVGLNTPVTQGEAMVMQNTGADLSMVKGRLAPQMQELVQQQPALGVVVEKQNQVAEMDVDIVLDEMPNNVTLQSEQFEQLVQLFQANPNGVPWEMIVEASSLRNKQKLLEMIKPNPEQQQAEMQEAQVAKQLALDKAMAEIEKIRSQAAKDQADVAKTQAETMKTQEEAKQKQLENVIVTAYPDVDTQIVV